MSGVIVTGSLGLIDAQTIRFLQNMRGEYGQVMVAPTHAAFPDIISLNNLRYALGQLRCVDTVMNTTAAIPSGMPVETFPLVHLEQAQATLQSPVADNELQPEGWSIDEILVNRPDPLVLLTGCFDLIHPGHFRLIEKAATYGVHPVVGILTTRGIRMQPKNKKGDRPFWSMNDRFIVLNELTSSPRVMLFDGPDSLEIIRSLKPDIFIKDKRDAMRTIIKQESRLVEKEGGRMEWSEEPYSGSTTCIASAVLGQASNYDV